MRPAIFGLLLLFVFPAMAQQRQTDSVARLVKQYFNEKNSEKLYGLTGEAFRKEISNTQFQSICSNQLFPLGELSALHFEKASGPVHQYKASFTVADLFMFIALDEKQLLSTFLFKPYKTEKKQKKEAVPSSNSLQSAMDHAVEKSARRYIQTEGTVGISIGILKNGKRSYYGYGSKNSQESSIPDEKTVYEIGSITKVFTAVLLMDAVQQKKLKLDDPVSKFFPEATTLEKNGKPVTLQMLSNHTSGLPRLPDNLDPANQENPYADYGNEQMIAYLKSAVPENEPGRAYAYSNLGVGLLGYILEKVNGKSFETLIQEKITRPLSMKNTGQTGFYANALIPGHDTEGNKVSQWDFQTFAAAGALRSSAEDLLRFAEANLGKAPGQLLSAIQKTHATSFTSNKLRMGSGWHYIRIDAEEWLFHNGGTGGYRSFLAIHPEKKMALILLSNSAADPDTMGHEILEWMQKN